MSGNGNQVPLAPSQRGPGPYPRASTPHRSVECYHSSTPAGVSSSLRVVPQQPSAPPAPQQDMSKNNMTGHNYVAPSQSQPRQQYQNFQFRATQHGARANSHQRQQSPFMPAAAASNPPVMYPTLVFQPTPMNMQSYQQPRSGSPGYYQYMGHYIRYNNPPSHSTPYYGYPTNGPQLQTPNLATSSTGGRSQPTTLVGPQPSPATPTVATATLPHTQPPTHLHQSMPGLRQAPQKRNHRPSYAVPIINPDTKQDIFSELYSTDSNFLSTDSNDRHTPQPEPAPTHSIAEEFSRMVNEAVNQPSHENTLKSNFIPKNVEIHVSSTSNSQPQINAISSLSSNNNNVMKSELVNVNDNRNPGSDDAVEPSETPVVSAISDSPVIVPKMTVNIKPYQKSDTTVQSVLVVTSKTAVVEKAVPSKPPKAADNVTESMPTVLAPADLEPQPQRMPKERLHRSEEKEKPKQHSQEKDILFTPAKQNGPMPNVISSVDSFQQAISISTSQYNPRPGADLLKKQLPPTAEHKFATVATAVKVEPTKQLPIQDLHQTPTELLSASIEKVGRDQIPVGTSTIPEQKSSAFDAQAKLTQSISSVCRTHQAEPKMNDIILNSQDTDLDTTNGNSVEITKAETAKEDINKNEKDVKNSKNNSGRATKMPVDNNEVIVKETEPCENGKNETDKIVNIAEVNVTKTEDFESKTLESPEEKPLDKPVEAFALPAVPPVYVPKYKYTDDQWSPLNKSGKKCYDIGLLKQIKEDPLSKNKPNVPLLEACNVIRTTPMQEPVPFTPIFRPMNDSLFPPFAKGSGMGGSRNPAPRDAKKNVPTGGVNSLHKPVIHVSLSLREDVKLNESDSAWKPTRFRRDSITEEEQKNQEVYKRFRGILNKLTPQKFDTLLDKVKTLEINTQKRLEGVIDLIFEKAIEEPNFSEAYAAMCNKLSMLKVPANNATNSDQCVNFRALIINKCQNQFEANKADDQVMKLEKEFNECTDPMKKKETLLMLSEEHRRLRMRSVGNVRFIGELYKLKMLTCKIMDYCMKYLIEKLEEEKLECLCKLLTTIGEQIENEETSQLDNIFKKMQEIVDRKSYKISSRVKFMIQDVIALRRRRWVTKSVVDSQPKMMDQIQKEAEQQQRHIELMNANPMGGGGGGFRRDEGGRNKRGGDGRRQNAFMDNTWKTPRTTNFPVDTSKLKAVTQKNLNNIKLAPHQSAWNHGSGTKAQVQASSSSQIGLSKNMYSVLENVQADPTVLRDMFAANRDMAGYHSKGVSIERSTFNSRSEYNVNSGNNLSGMVGVPRSSSVTRSQSSAPATPPLAPEVPTPEPKAPVEPLSEEKIKKIVKSTIELYFINKDINELVHDINKLFQHQYHAAVVSEILNIILEKASKEVTLIATALLQLVSKGTISADNFLAGLKDTFEFAPDLYIDVPMLYDYLGKITIPQIEKKHITLEQILNISENIVAAHQGNILLKAILNNMVESMGPTFVKSKWQESSFKLNQWMSDDEVLKWKEDNKYEFLETDVNVGDESKQSLTPEETQSRLLQLLNADESCDCIKGWVQDKLGKASNEDWFMRALIQAVCEHALFGTDGRDVPHFNQDRMSKYTNLIHEFGESKDAREASCLRGIQHLIHRLEHPQGLTLQIFQYLHEQYIISLDGFLAWEQSDKDPEGRGVMMVALTSFFTNIKEADNEESCSED